MSSKSDAPGEVKNGADPVPLDEETQDPAGIRDAGQKSPNFLNEMAASSTATAAATASTEAEAALPSARAEEDAVDAKDPTGGLRSERSEHDGDDSTSGNTSPSVPSTVASVVKTGADGPAVVDGSADSPGDNRGASANENNVPPIPMTAVEEEAVRMAVRDNLQSNAGAYRITPGVVTRLESGGEVARGIRGVDSTTLGRDISDGADTDQAQRTASSGNESSLPTECGPWNLPPNIDIIAEATLVQDDNVPGGIQYDGQQSVDAVSNVTAQPGSEPARQQSSIGVDAARQPAAANASSGQAIAATEIIRGDDPEVPTPVAEGIATAEAMDKLSVVLCGHLFKCRWWHVGLLAVALALCVAVPVSVVLSRDKDSVMPSTMAPTASPRWLDDFVSTDADSNEVVDLEGLRSAVAAVVVPSVSHPEDVEDPNSPQSRAIDWLASGGGARAIEAKTLEDADWRIRQRYILAVLYYSTGGEGWKNQFGYLNTTLHECEWGGLWNGWMSTDCDEDMEVTLVNLWQNNLRGTIPRELAGLPSLNTIDFLTNKLKGSVPEELTAVGLNYLNLGYNQLTGTVHASYGDMTEITYLMLDYNDLVGPIPSELGKMTQLSGWLSLEGNDLTGTIPGSFANLTQAAWIYLNGNRLTGSAEFLCDALDPSMGPNATESSEESPLLELWVDRDEVTCSCCNCCPMVED